ncbi:hypothetical protein [Salinivibrio sp. IB282]|uniref:hypothetical protein n=1 Tax=Salinivibrio sp. IB282 TaxID=1766122 RepID=UPI00098871B3|nr:hypothetical protein [Salinivibrio sp. IB282]OOE57350.1 hypothetical protein BZG14_15065 [Salinivibrio sp. IB282]
MIFTARHPTSSLKLALIVTGARWQFAPIQHRAGACVTYANGTTDVKVRVGRHKRQLDRANLV